MVLPYVAPPDLPGDIQPYAVLLLVAVTAGFFTSLRLGRRAGMATDDLGLLLGLSIFVAFVAGHVFDVIVYARDRAAHDPGLWLRMRDGHSLFGALIGVAITTVIIARVRKLALAPLADVVALGFLVATTIGRVGCAVVHDHLGHATDSPFGVDVPRARLYSMRPYFDGDSPTVRVHDLGLAELVLLVPVTAAAFLLARRRLPPGRLAALIAITYATVRFGLDFLRHPSVEPRHLGLTVGQWCCLALAAVAAVAIRRLAPRQSSGYTR